MLHIFKNKNIIIKILLKYIHKIKRFINVKEINKNKSNLLQLCFISLLSRETYADSPIMSLIDLYKMEWGYF